MLPESFTEYFKSLDETERHCVITELMSINTYKSPLGVSEAIFDVQQSTKVSCPHCSSTEIRANGKHNGVQRYYCKSCSTYFRDTTGKVSFGLKKGNLLKTYLYHMLMGLSIEKCAKQTGICVQTSFDWRHKILAAFEQSVPEGFHGIVESDDIFFLESDKGSRALNRPARKRGSKATKRGISNEQVAVVVTCDRSDNKELRVVTKGRISKKDLDHVLEGKLDKAETLCTDTHRSYTAFAKSIALNHQKFNVSKGQRVKNKVYHVQNVNNTAKRLRQWMKPFNGVATKYLQNYMNWFMILERIKQNREQLKAFAFYAFAGQQTWENWKRTSNSVVF